MKTDRHVRRPPVAGKRAAPAQRRWLPWALATLIAGAAVLVYIPAFSGGWSWDDDLSVYSNPMVTQPGQLGRIWLTTEDHDFWPLTRTAFRIEYAIFKNDPAGYHAVNIILHALASILIYLVLRQLGVPGAALCGLVFAIHPVNAATAVWISELKNILSMIFLAATVLAWLRFERDTRWTWYAAAFLFYAAALASKTSVVTFPAMLLGLAWWRRGRICWRDVAATVPFFLAAGGMALMTLLVQERGVNVLTQPLVGLDKLAGAGWVFWFYVYKALVPVGLSAIYPHWKDAIESLGWIAYLPTAALVAVVVVSWLKRRTAWGRPLLLAEAFCLLAMFPVMGFFTSTIMMHSLVADHLQYLPIVGVIALGCAAGWTLVRGRPRARIAGGIAAAAIVGMLGAATVARAGVLAFQDRLWADTLIKNPNSWAAHYSYATALTLRARERLGEVLRASSEIDKLPRQAPSPDARGDTASSALSGETADARRRELTAKVAEVQELCRESVVHYRESIRIQPLDVRTYNNLGLALVGLDQADEAIQVYRKGIELNARYYGGKQEPTLWFNLGEALLAKGRFSEAVPACQKAVGQMPGDETAVANLVKALVGLAWTRATSPDLSARNSEEALSCLRQLQSLVPSPDPALQDVGAAVLADAGRFSEAIAVASEALRAAREQHNDRLASAIAGRVQLYSMGQPYREPR